MSTHARPFKLFSLPGLLFAGALYVSSMLGSTHAWAQAPDEATEEATDEVQVDDESGSVGEALGKMADEVQRFLAANGQEKVVVGQFNGPPGVSGTAAIVKSLQDKLDDKVDVVRAGADFGVQGKYSGGLDETTGLYSIQIDAEIVNRQGATANTLTKYIITDEATGLAMMGSTVNLEANTPATGSGVAKAKERAEAIVESVENPQVEVTDGGPKDAPAGGGPGGSGPGGNAPGGSGTPLEIAGTVIRAPGSPYGIEILVVPPKGPAQPLPAVDEGGLAFVDIGKDQLYAIRLINDSPHAAGVILTIDGINTLAFSQNPAFVQTGKWVVAPGAVGFVKGWHIGGPLKPRTPPVGALAFKVTDYGDSAAAEMGITGDSIGTITAVFCAAWEDPRNPPKDEVDLGNSSRGDLATGKGPPVDQKAAPRFLHYGRPRASISVRYSRPAPDDSDLPAGEPAPQ